MIGGSVIVDERFCFEEETRLTVHKTSMFFPGDGFVVYDDSGEVILRVDSYGLDSHPKDELVLMDSSGKSLLTLIRKKLSLHRRWEGFLGLKKDVQQEPIFSIQKASIIKQSDVAIEVFGNGHQTQDECHIEGSFSERSCSIYKADRDVGGDESRAIVAEIRRKVDPDTNVVLAKDVFLLCVRPGIDAAFVMALVLVLDNMDWYHIHNGFMGNGPS